VATPFFVRAREEPETKKKFYARTNDFDCTNLGIHPCVRRSTVNGSSFPPFDPVRKAGAQTDSTLFVDGVRVRGRAVRRGRCGVDVGDTAVPIATFRLPCAPAFRRVRRSAAGRCRRRRRLSVTYERARP
jgi:hypothetical protein